MKKILTVALIGIGMGFGALTGCGKSGGTGGSGGSSGTSNPTCNTMYLCQNGSCACGADGKGNSCPDAMTCAMQCKMCIGVAAATGTTASSSTGS